MDPLRLIVRILFAYAFALIMVRVSGHRAIKHVDIQSFVVALVIGDLFDDLFWLEVPASQFVVAVGSLFIVHMAASVQWFRSGRRTWGAIR